MLTREIIVPHLLVKIEQVEEIDEGEHPDHREEEHHQGVEELDHVPVHALVPEVQEPHFCVVNLFLLKQRMSNRKYLKDQIDQKSFTR